MDANLYKNNNLIQQDTVMMILEKYGSKIKWKKNINKIFDVGCGEGTVITRIKKYFPPDSTIVACDINKGMIELAKEQYCDGNICFIVLDITDNLPHEIKGNYSHVVSFYCLNWVMDQEKAFNNIYSLLEPGGECFLLIVHRGAVFELYRNLAQNKKWNTWVNDVERYISPYCDSQEPEKEVKKIMENSGFENVYIEYDHIFYSYDDMKTMKGSLLGIFPFKIPSDKLDEFWEDCIKELRLLKGCDNSVTNIKYNYKLLTIHACKSGDTAE